MSTINYVKHVRAKQNCICTIIREEKSFIIIKYFLNDFSRIEYIRRRNPNLNPKGFKVTKKKKKTPDIKKNIEFV